MIGLFLGTSHAVARANTSDSGQKYEVPGNAGRQWPPLWRSVRIYSYRRVGVRRSNSFTSAAAVPGPNAALYWPRLPSTQSSAKRIASLSGFESPSKRTVSRISTASGAWLVPQALQTRLPSADAAKSWGVAAAAKSLHGLDQGLHRTSGFGAVAGEAGRPGAAAR